MSSVPGLGGSPGEGKGYPLQCSGLENSMDCLVRGVAESDTTERLSLPVSQGVFRSMPHSHYAKFYQRVQFLSLAATPVTHNPVHGLEHAWHTLSPAPGCPLTHQVPALVPAPSASPPVGPPPGQLVGTGGPSLPTLVACTGPATWTFLADLCLVLMLLSRLADLEQCRKASEERQGTPSHPTNGSQAEGWGCPSRAPVWWSWR